MLTEYAVPRKRSSPWKWILIILLLAGLGFGAYVFMKRFIKISKISSCPATSKNYFSSFRFQTSDYDAL